MDSSRLRLTYAAAVAVVSLSATVALASNGGAEPAGPSARHGAARVASISPQRMQQVADRVTRLQRSDGAAVPGVSERELRTFETATLGSEHAAEHASNRALERENPAGLAREYRALEESTPRVTAPASQVGQWAKDSTGDVEQIKIPTFAIHSIMLPTGEVLWFSYEVFARGGDANRNTSQAYLWNPTTRVNTKVNPPVNPDTGKPYNVWCAGHTLTSDGRVVVFGGNLALQDLANGKYYKGLNTVFTFNPWTRAWVQQPSMNHGRWYPSGINRPDGTIPILSGLDESGDYTLNQDIEVFTPSADRDATDAAGVGTLKKIGNEEAPGAPPGSNPPASGETYPHLFWMGSGRMLVAGPGTRDTWWMNSDDTSQAGWWNEAPDMNLDRRLWGNAVPLATDDTGPHQVMAIGGADPTDAEPRSTPFASTELFDENDASGGKWDFANPLNVGRAHANAVLLPDGGIVEIGGGIGTDQGTTGGLNGGQYESTAEQKQVELWDPDTKEWTLGPAQKQPRAYHSTALLLPDGRVVSAGDDRGAKSTDGDTAEIYEPPYLHQGGIRPKIISAPATAAQGTSFDVSYLAPSASITRAALVAPGSATHAVDMNQRYIPLQVSGANGVTVKVKAPASANAAPPGYYMLFLLDSRGVPTVSKFVRLTGTGPNDYDPDQPVDPGQPGDSSPPATTQPGTTTTPPSTTTTTTTPQRTTTRSVRLRVSSASATRGTTLRALRRQVAVRCRATATRETRTCRVTLRERLSRRRTRTIGTATATLGRGRDEARISVTLSPAALRALAARGSLPVYADLRVRVQGARGVVKSRQAYRLVD